MSAKATKIPDTIIEFIREHHVLTMASSFDNQIWCANAFYTIIEEENLLIITSDQKTKHIDLALKSIGDKDYPMIAGSIVLETEAIGKIRGLQFTAKLIKIDELFSKYKIAYLKRFPYAILKGGDLWILKLTELKFTDNRLGFGEKLLVSLEQ